MGQRSDVESVALRGIEAADCEGAGYVSGGVSDDSCLAQEIEDACDHRRDDADLQQALDGFGEQHEYNNDACRDKNQRGQGVYVL